MTIGLILNTRPEIDRNYQKIIKDLGHRSISLDVSQENWLNQFKKIDKQVDVYYWQSLDRGSFYRRDILDPVYFIGQVSNHKIFPNFNQYYYYNDKIKQTNILNYYDLPTPKTFYTTDKKTALNYLGDCDYPFVLKDPHSASSLGVYLIRNKKEALAKINKIFSPTGLNSLYYQFYAQEFIPNLEKSLRLITINHKTYCAYWRKTPGSWKHRLAEKSYITAKNIPAKAKKICELASKKLNFPWMSWDILIKDDNYYIIEFSCNFGTRGAENLGFNPKEQIIKYLINKTK
jgi:ribosomal protein S6--L-glutamate ligase